MENDMVQHQQRLLLLEAEAQKAGPPEPAGRPPLDTHGLQQLTTLLAEVKAALPETPSHKRCRTEGTTGQAMETEGGGDDGKDSGGLQRGAMVAVQSAVEMLA
eukprot:8124576-Prorocentrum_lima.AAC.1